MWKKKVEAGILVYALLMAAVFSLLLQFYLNRQVSSQRLQLFNRERTEAYAMAVLTKATAKDDSGEMEFEQGKAAYRKEGKELEISSRLSSGHSYSFTFVISKKEEKAKEDKKATAKKEKAISDEAGKSD
ncbi:competence protein ComGG [Streptococcus sanguinis]|uniref:competence type IV pilus minor pilin ComGG n=1 Tax=Streptococcus sanguinis TaxID=1305 RepID=UPI001CC148C2|nr:competence type IV pilus minor pilin ComGG [Streptococcus sanguinis]MBZ2038367.1 competence protein ComGG [Streptococcus sanguinis]MBZ2068734.1 competence protein ComGG [Streptococcus sanguinis]MBZ2070750.1 competence protein ComGG [Streptococcus sanguinis]